MATPLLRDYLLNEFAIRLEKSIGKVLPAFGHSTAPGWQGRLWQWDAGSTLNIFIRVSWWAREDGFTIELAWAPGTAFPRETMSIASATPACPQHRFALSELWSPGHPERGWSFLPSGLDGTGHRPRWMFDNRRGMEREFDLFDAGLRSADNVVADAISKLVEYGIPFLRDVAATHGISNVEVDRWLPLTDNTAPRHTAQAGDGVSSGTSAPVRDGIPRAVSDTAIAGCPATRRALRHYSSVFHRELPRFWNSGLEFKLAEVALTLFMVALLLAFFFAPPLRWPFGGISAQFYRWFAAGVWLALILSGTMNSKTRYERRLRHISDRKITDEEFHERLQRLHPSLGADREIMLVVRRAYARSLDLPAEVIGMESSRPCFHMFDSPPLLHEFAIYLSELLPSKPDPFILGNLLARRQRRVGILDFIEATEVALRDIDKAEPRGRAHK